MTDAKKKLLYVIGIGPGKTEGMTREAYAALQESSVLAGYPVYLSLLPEELRGKEEITTGMTQELERCRLALEAADSGKTVSLVCSGDAGVYGMAGPVLSLAEDYPEVEVRILPGVTAASAGAAVLGAPLMHDFTVISMSDRLTPMDLIRKRLRLAAEADMVIVLYNPESVSRAGYLRMACDILLESLPSERAVGYVRKIGREGQASWTGTLGELREETVDMFTTVFIGNSTTCIRNGRMITDRGYPGIEIPK